MVKLFIYPTDTLYGLGCDASNTEAVDKIFAIKNREQKPLMVAVPSFQWMFAYIIIPPIHRLFIESKLPFHLF